MRNRFTVEPPLARIILGGIRELEVLLDDADLGRAAELPGSWFPFARQGCLYAAGQVVLSPPATTSLPSGVEIRPGEIVIRYGTPEEAMEHLLAIGIQAQEDWEAVRAKLSNGDQDG